MFRKFPEIEKQLSGRELWNDGYFASSAGDKVTSGVICQHIKHWYQEWLFFDF
jgi:REP element-mobilizing transposase RayT